MNIASMHHNSRRTTAVSFFATLLLTISSVQAQSGPELLLRPWPKGQRIEAQADAAFFNAGHTTHDEDFQLAFYNTQGRMRLMPEERAEPRLGYDVTYLNINTTNPVLPSKLVDTSIGFGMGIADYKGWLAGITVGVGYAGAGAYDDGNAWYGKADLVVGRDLDETTKLGFVLDYDGNRTILPDVPLPGFLYAKTIDPTLTIGIGFPYSSITWKPDKSRTFDRQLTIELKYLIPDDGDVRVDYELIDHVGVFASYAVRQEAFHSDNLANTHDRILFQQRRAEVGARWSPCEFASLIVAGGYAFSQEFNVGWDTTDMDRIAKPSDEPYFRVGFEVRY